MGPAMFAVLAVVVVLLSSSFSYVHNEAASISLIEDIDGDRRRGRRVEPDEDHGHHGLEGIEMAGTPRYTNEWVVEITGGPRAAAAIAEEMGYEIIGEVPSFDNLYRMHKSDHPRRGRTHSESLTTRLADDVRVLWAEQQFAKRRQKRGFIRQWESEIEESETGDAPLVRVKRTERDGPRPLPSFYEDMPSPSKRRFQFNDELWDHQWYMHDTRTAPMLPRLDLNLLPVYDMGYSGRGVNIVVLDDGLEINHTDIRANYNPEISYDINDDDPDPTPRYGQGLRNSHGTRCAGEISMQANNGKCGVGVAYNSKIGGIRMLDGTVTDRVEASSLTFALDKVDIYSASWGPSDDGRTVEGPGRLARQSFYRGITEGRQGKGVIYIWAAGNGGRKEDNCNCDGYVSSIYTLSIGSVSEQGAFPWYGEKCAATMAVTYSSGAYTDQKIATVDLNDKCTMDHTGTSASAPLAAGIVALALEANPNLTWRDVQHLVVWTSEYKPLQLNREWQENAAGLRYNLRFGFGLMNAAKLVEWAGNWTTVPEKSTCTVQGSQQDIPLTQSQWASIEFQSETCNATSNSINYLEHVEVIVNVDYPVRGRLEIDLISPSGTRTQVLKPRPKDNSAMGFINWPFMSVHTWGEKSQGQWKLIVTDMSTEDPALPLLAMAGRIINATLILHGTTEMPAYRKNGQRIYDDAFNHFTEPRPLVETDERPTADLNQLRAHKPDISWNDLIGLKLSRQAT